MSLYQQARSEFIRELFSVPAPADLFTESDEEIDGDWAYVTPAQFTSSWDSNLRTQNEYEGY